MKILQESPLRLLISNDAFFCLNYDEEPLDEASLDEAKEIISMFPNGFNIGDDWEYEGDTGLIAATFIANQERPAWPTHQLELFGGWILLFRIEDGAAKACIWHPTKGSRFNDTIPIEYKGKNPWVTINKSCYPLWGRVQKWAH